MCIEVKYGIWNVTQPEMGSVNALVSCGYSPLSAMILASRGIHNQAEATNYLSCNTPLLDPFLMTDMDLAAGRVGLALATGDSKAVLIAIDHCGIVKSVLNPMRQHICDVTGLPWEAVYIHATHTHTAPFLNPNPTDPLEIVKQAYALKDGQTLPYVATLTGKVILINTHYGAGGYNNVAITLVVEGREEYPILCYRIKGDGADSLLIGDTITVPGGQLRPPVEPLQGHGDHRIVMALSLLLSRTGGKVVSMLPPNATPDF